ncbi:MAG: 23S rRNA (pseudouridine(1915)-N(3))-methyltransferase RlmH [Saprospiraceae bacterium]|nr:23S rRNA (pseudouridine(1915)-N(3))-methyltransferase RlmH [Saprospiraceae bacterium]
MNIELWCIGKTQFDYVMNGVEEFKGRIKHYSSFNIIYIEGYRQNPGDNPQIVKDKEAENILKKLDSRDYLILLDEKGIEMNSIEFAGFIEKKMIYGSKTIIFLIGGAFGFSQKIYERANDKISLSKMTFSHQLIRLIFTEQLYRAFTIIKNEKYHNT